MVNSTDMTLTFLAFLSFFFILNFKEAVSYNQRLKYCCCLNRIGFRHSRGCKNNSAKATHSVYMLYVIYFYVFISRCIWNTSLLNNEINCICPIYSHYITFIFALEPRPMLFNNLFYLIHNGFFLKWICFMLKLLIKVVL